MKKRTKKAPTLRRSALADTLHSWTFRTWPDGVYPNDGDRAKHMCRVHRDELVKAQALIRVGHELVILEGGYTAWLRTKGGGRVLDYTIAPNQPEHAAARRDAKKNATRANGQEEALQ
jgi:hypothetical protein